MYHIMGTFNDEIGRSIGEWYSKQVKRDLCGPYTAIGFLDNQGILKGAAIFEGYNGANVNIHIYGPRCLTRSNIKIVYKYVFDFLKCIRITAIIRRSNKKLLKNMPKLDFIFEGILKNYFGPSKQEDGIIYKITLEKAINWME